MITTVALTVLMPVTGINPAAPVQLPGPKLPIEIIQPVRLNRPGTPPPIHRIEAMIPRPEEKAPSAIDTLRKMVKDDRPIAIGASFDSFSLGGGPSPVYAGR